jgi:hypothetical protein
MYLRKAQNHKQNLLTKTAVLHSNANLGDPNHPPPLDTRNGSVLLDSILRSWSRVLIAFDYLYGYSRCSIYNCIWDSP